ncbi:hypothetical protein EV183_003756 [Coemansia sp. RSA 2336]|nr:hypothetical protein EV183_003756 [Coemansia sp. RSA 2336]
MGMTRRRQAITERVPTTPRKVVVYTDNLMTSNSARSSTTNDSGKEARPKQRRFLLADSLGETLNTALVISTSFRFDPELNMLEILDPYNPRNNIEVKGISNYKVSVKLFILPAASDANNRPAPLYVKQALTCLKKQLGSVLIDEFFVSFTKAPAHAGAPGSQPRQPEMHKDQMANGNSSSSSSSQKGSQGEGGSDADEMRRYSKVWRMTSRLRSEGDVAKIGICDVSRGQLEHLCEHTGVVPDMVQVRIGEMGDGDVDQADIEDLREFAQQHGISIRTHSDSEVMLSNATFQALAADYKINERFPTTEVPPEGYKIDLMRPRWVANYSVTIRNRGLVANRGYIVMASSDCVLDPNRVSRNIYEN